jgi:hypothetical protein
VASSVGTVTVTLFGAVTGGVITSRFQTRHWRRDQQIDACTAIVSESARTQLALRRQWRHRQNVDWNGWDQALAMISLVGIPSLVQPANDMDAAFWASTARVVNLGTADEASWTDVVQCLEAARLNFINVARQEVVGLNYRLEKLPMPRPMSNNE